MEVGGRWVIRLVLEDDVPETGQLCVSGNWGSILGRGAESGHQEAKNTYKAWMIPGM